MKKFKIPVRLDGENVEHYLYRMLHQAYPDWDDSEIDCMKGFIERNLIELVEPTDPTIDCDRDYHKVLKLITFWKKNKWRFDW